MVLPLANEAYVHWFLIPVAMCGIIVGTDCLDWLRGRLDLLDPIGILGAVGVHFFVVAPLLHVAWDHWLWSEGWFAQLPEPVDWRNYLGTLAAFHFIGLVCYRWMAGRVGSSADTYGKQAWRIKRHTFVPALFFLLALTLIAQFVVYDAFGGIVGYVAAYESRDPSRFEGLGLVFTVSEAFPALVILGFAVLIQSRQSARKMWVLALFLAVVLVLKLLFGGLRGSRSNTIWGIFWAVGVIHVWIRPISRRAFVAMGVAAFSFIYAYGFYKALGREAIIDFGDPDQVQELEERSGRDRTTVLLGDLGRADVQTYLLYASLQPERDAQYAWGRTYLASIALVVPRWIWPDRPPSKVKEGTEWLYGSGTFARGRRSSRVHGLTGEAIMNFTPLFIPVAFLVLGAVVGWVRKLYRSLEPFDARLLAVPLLVNLCFVLLYSDSDNVLFFLVKNGLLPVGLLWLGSARVQAGEATVIEKVTASG